MPNAAHLAAAILIWLLALPAWQANAGNVASLEILGFSDDASIFAFEEYGVQDGSGFPYANRYYLDVEGDEFLPGTPFRVLLQDENATVEQARAQAAAAGQPIVGDVELAANRGWLAAANAITELSADPFLIKANPRPVIPPIDDPVEIRLEEIAMPSPQRCENLGPTKGYRFFLDGKLLHEDKSVPQSRGCPLGYRLGALQTAFPDTGEASFAVLIAVRSFGFEGPDFRWIAVTGRL